MEYKITQKILDLVEALFKEGYTGTAEITNSYPTGTAKVLGGSFSVELSGFSKETLFLTSPLNTQDVVFVGRYDHEGLYIDPTVEDVVFCAWHKYKVHKERGFSLPSEFEELFKKYGYLKKKVVEVYEEQD